ncbi:unnamed protein product [Didymodactylos carnosus]|uniref:Uncharacterized protein n=1 Tax=Didymodactylos carnosus TaxID=1234261 RepID=A0A8S2EBP7_9BILA|nr:unnamed protein product [Didymodactylos carnosus]CAF3864070.1 unnamed protein product [Didymodactylos carnosus]
MFNHDRNNDEYSTRSNSSVHDRQENGAYPKSATLVVSKPKETFKTLILKLEDRNWSPGKVENIRQLINEIKNGMLTNLDLIVHHLLAIRPQPDNLNYDKAAALYQSILDNTIDMIEDLEKTMDKLLTEFNLNIQKLWNALLEHRHDETARIKKELNASVEKVSKKWDQAFDGVSKQFEHSKKQLDTASQKQNQ